MNIKKGFIQAKYKFTQRCPAHQIYSALSGTPNLQNIFFPISQVLALVVRFPKSPSDINVGPPYSVGFAQALLLFLDRSTQSWRQLRTTAVLTA